MTSIHARLRFPRFALLALAWSAALSPGAALAGFEIQSTDGRVTGSSCSYGGDCNYWTRESTDRVFDLGWAELDARFSRIEASASS